jgi:hypothetical protein
MAGNEPAQKFAFIAFAIKRKSSGLIANSPKRS